MVQSMDEDAPRSAAEPRDGEPYYIASECPECSTQLVLNDTLEEDGVEPSATVSKTELDSDPVWHDKWVCPNCQDGIHLDAPKALIESLFQEADSYKTMYNYEIPVSLDNQNPGIGLTPGTKKSDIVALLYNNDEYGYTPQHIFNELDISHNTAKFTLKRLYDSDYINKTPEGYYHAREDREDLYRYTAALDGLDRMFATYEGDNTEEELSETVEMESAELSEENIDYAVDIVDNDSHN